MAKYETQFKHAVVKRCLVNGSSAMAVGKEFGVDHGTVRRWVQSYRHHGLNGLSKKHEHYSAEFKLSVLRRMKKERLSYREVEAMFNLREHGAVSRWERRYHEGGLEALKSKPKGRQKMMKPRLRAAPAKTKATDSRTREELLDEIEYLRAEVDYLKKRRALVLAQEATAQKKRG